MKERFAFEELEVWQRAVAFADRVIQLAENLDTTQKHYRLIDQLKARPVEYYSTGQAVTSVPIKIFSVANPRSKGDHLEFVKNWGKIRSVSP